MNGTNITFYSTSEGYAHWMINNETPSDTHPHIEEKYTAQGFTFDYSVPNNLTLHVSASEKTNNSLIECWVISCDYSITDRSEKANLYVFSTFCKLVYIARVIIISIHA